MTGSYGCEAIAQVLDGTVNPSGRTVDTYASNSLSAPSVVNGGVEGVSTWGNAAELNDYDKINGDENIDYYIIYLRASMWATSTTRPATKIPS